MNHPLAPLVNFVPPKARELLTSWCWGFYLVLWVLFASLDIWVHRQDLPDSQALVVLFGLSYFISCLLVFALAPALYRQLGRLVGLDLSLREAAGLTVLPWAYWALFLTLPMTQVIGMNVVAAMCFGLWLISPVYGIMAWTQSPMTFATWGKAVGLQAVVAALLIVAGTGMEKAHQLEALRFPPAWYTLTITPKLIVQIPQEVKPAVAATLQDEIQKVVVSKGHPKLKIGVIKQFRYDQTVLEFTVPITERSFSGLAYATFSKDGTLLDLTLGRSSLVP